MSRDYNVSVFNDTLRLCKEDCDLVSSINNSKKNEELILSDSILPVETQRFNKKCDVIVSNKRTLEAASNYKEKRVTVLNFASFRNPGGGVLNGSSAQEESLCRISTLYMNLIDEGIFNSFYKPHRNCNSYFYNDDAIYTPSVTVFKSDDSKMELLDKNKWYSVDVLTIAAPNLRNIYNYDRKELTSILEKRIRRIYSILKYKKTDIAILGAFGCGAFYNPPEIVSSLFFSILKEYLFDFETIEFAIYTSRSDDSNYLAFKEALRKETF